MYYATDKTVLFILTILFILLIYKLRNADIDTKIALYLSVPYILVEGSARLFELYRIFPHIDVPSHFFFGVGATALLILMYKKSYKFSLAVILSIGIIWEMSEIVFDRIFPDFPNWYKDIFFWDGFWDITVKVLGSIIVGYVLIRKNEG
jgi:hypothetical protein